MFPSHYYLCDKNKGMPLYFYTQFFQPNILAVPVTYVQGCQVLTTALLQRPDEVVSSYSLVQTGKPVPVDSSYIQDNQAPIASSSCQSGQTERTILEPIPDDYQFSFTKKLDDGAKRHCSRSSQIQLTPPELPKQAPPKQAPPLGSTPRRQNRRRLQIITKTKKIDFDLPEEFD